MPSVFTDTKLKDFVLLQRGFDLPKKDRLPGIYPVVASTSIQGFHSEYKVLPPGVITGRSGSLGTVQYINNPFWPLNTALSVKDFKGNHPRFVFYLLQTLGLERYNSGAGVPTLNRNHLDSLVVRVPSVPTQRTIASILSTYDDLIENNLRRINILEDMAKNLYREWLINFRFPGHDKTRFVDSSMGRIPEGWARKELGELSAQERVGVDPGSVPADMPYIGLEHIPRNSITMHTWGKAADVQSTKYLFHEGDILFGKIRPYFHKVSVAPINGICSSDTIVIRTLDPLTFGPVLCCVSSEEFVAHATQTSNGTKMPRANWNVLVKYPIAIPPEPILRDFTRKISEHVKLTQALASKNSVLQQTRDLLLPKLISGEVDVAELDITFPRETA